MAQGGQIQKGLEVLIPYLRGSLQWSTPPLPWIFWRIASVWVQSQCTNSFKVFVHYFLFGSWLHWGALGAVLGLTWTRFGCSGNALGDPRGTLGPLLGRSCTLLGPLGSLLKGSLRGLKIFGRNLRPKMEASWLQNRGLKLKKSMLKNNTFLTSML